MCAPAKASQHRHAVNFRQWVISQPTHRDRRVLLSLISGNISCGEMGCC